MNILKRLLAPQHVRATAVAFATLLVACFALFGPDQDRAIAHEYKAGPLMIDHPWARPTLGQSKISAGYMTIKNTGTSDDQLISAKTNVAKVVELHTHTNENGVMRMRKLDGGIKLPAGQSVSLKPGGLHLMLIDLTEKLEKGTKVPIELTFEKAGTLTVEAAIEMSGDKSDRADHSAHGAHSHGASHGEKDSGHAGHGDHKTN
ncbi:MAG: copper chaperone PCu(A)C [Pseudomonadota bacterium]